MEESKQIPDDNNSIELSSEIEKESKKGENVKAFTEFLEKASNQESNEEKVKTDIKAQKKESKYYSLFNRFINDGFDGISSKWLFLPQNGFNKVNFFAVV